MFNLRAINFPVSLLKATCACIVVFCLSFSALAQEEFKKFRRDSDFFRPDTALGIASLFIGPNAWWPIAGGVVMDGPVSFYLEDGSRKTRIAPEDVSIKFEGDRVYLVLGQEDFFLDSHLDILCSMANFVSRGGKLAYSQPPRRGPAEHERLQSLGLTLVGLNRWVAHEFSETGYDLVYGADFADVEPLASSTLAQYKRAAAETSVETDWTYSTREWTSYINSDQQIEYQVYLNREFHAVAVSGVPLRYKWIYNDLNDSPILNNIEVWSTNFESELLREQGAEANQYDFIVLYQNTAILREIFRVNPISFDEFKEDACEI